MFCDNIHRKKRGEMKKDELEERIKKVVSSLLKVPQEKISSSSDFVKDLGAESIQSLELVAAFEHEFGIEMDEEESLEVKTMGKAVEFIGKILKEQGKLEE